MGWPTMKVALTGGGTGGHIYPALSIAEALKTRSLDVGVMYVGGRCALESRLVPEAGIPFYGITARGMRRRSIYEAALVGASLARGLFEAHRLLSRLKPDVVVGTGGYVAAALVWAAAQRRVPTLIHEQNTVAGRTNRFLGKRVDRVCLTFSEAKPAFPAEKTVITGLPVRSIIQPGPIEESRARLGLPEGFTIAAFGGSQGARGLNNVLLEAASDLTAQGINILHQVGERDYDMIVGRAKLAGDRYRAVPFLKSAEMADTYRVADLAVCRSGAATLSELAIAGLPAILVPFPFATDDHQTRNAQVFEKHGAAVLCRQSDLNREWLVKEIIRLQHDVATRNRMAAMMKELARPQAADEIAEIVVVMGENRWSERALE